MPVSFPLRAGMTLPTALAAPVEAGMMFWFAPRPSRHSYKHKKLQGTMEITPNNLTAYLKFKLELTTKIMMNHLLFNSIKLHILSLKYRR
jgi:hypothetical protein